LNYTSPKGLVGQIFVDRGNNNFEWVCNLEVGAAKGSLNLQPGNYKVVYREKDQKSTAYTKEKIVRIDSNKTITLNF
jgi:Ca-activated chloride channel family protein